MVTSSSTLAHEEEYYDWTGTYTWKVKNWTQLTVQRIYSPEFEIGGYSWRLLVFPNGNNWRGTSECISVYLDFAEVSFTPPQLCPPAEFELIALKRTNPRNSTKRESSHTFTAQAKDWGFAKFLPLQQALNPTAGYLVNNVLTLRVNVYIHKRDNLRTRSKLETGLLGIKGSEDTSLLSSFLQCLFHITVLRNTVFHVQTQESVVPRESLPLALQHLFYKLKYWNISAATKDLVKALNCSLNDAHLQHGMRNIQNILFDKLSQDFRANGVMDCISELFIGQNSTYIESLEMPDAPTFKQSFMDISLDVLDCKNIYASLEKLCHVQTLGEGILRRNCSRELGELKHYMKFDSFPSILVFHLKRSYYNPDLNAILRVNTHYEFYDELDLDYNDRVLMSKNADQTIENKYKLHSVLVRAGRPDQGHYFAFIRCREKWFKFDGEIVKVVSAKEVINAQFGDKTGVVNANFSKRFKSIDNSAAVMLVYLRLSEWKKVMCDANNNCLPTGIKQLFYKDREAREKRYKEKTEAHLYVVINLATEFHFAEQIGKTYYFDLVDFDSIQHYRIHKTTPFEDFKRMVSKDFEIPRRLQRFWLWNKRSNNTVRVSKPLMEGPQDLKTVLDLKLFREICSPLGQEKTALMTINLFLETPERYSPQRDGILHRIQRDELLIFVKYYDPISKHLSYLGHMFVKKSLRFCVILERAKKMAGLGFEDNVIGFEESRYLPRILSLGLSSESSPIEDMMTNGAIIIIQKLVNVNHSAFPFVKEFLEHVQNA